jgi:amino acid adenylation domain-containing protein
VNPGSTLVARCIAPDSEPVAAIMITPDRARPPTQGFVRSRESRHVCLDAATGRAKPDAEHLRVALVSLLWRYGESDTVMVGVFNDVNPSSIPTAMPMTFKITSTTTADDLSSQLRQVSQEQSAGDVTMPGLTEAVFDRHPLFQVAFACPGSAFDDESAIAQVIDDVADSAIRCDLTFITVHNEDMTTLVCDYDANLFEAATVNRLLAQWETLATLVSDHPSVVLSTLDMMSPEERGLVMQWSQGPRVERKTRTVHDLFAQIVARSPGAPAVVFGAAELTYRELNDIADNLAALLSECGVEPQAKVVTCLRRSLRVPAVYLGVLKSANAFVPLDPESPIERAATILADLGASMIICDSQEDATKLVADSESTVLVLDDIWPNLVSSRSAHHVREVRPVDLAYVIYTSGSTGTPKGVMVEHASICNRLQHNEFILSNDDRVLQKTPLTFDVSVWEIFAPLIHGSQLVIAEPGGHRDSDYLISEIDRRSITTVHFVPSMLRQFLKDTRPGCCATLQRVTSSGEVLPLDLIRAFRQQFPALPLYNYYGPTEASVDVTFWRCEDDPTTRAVPIGRPIENVTTYILDEQGRPAPIGVAGDLFLGGAALARGYTDPDLDAGRFIHSRWSPSERLYASGDRARWLADGTIEYLGRNDRQVKIRGVRIELGDIETALRAFKDVQDAAVITRQLTSAGQDLVAYVETTPAAEEVSARRLRELLRPRLPAYMIPAEFVVVASLPHNSAGKIDYKQLANLKGNEQRSATASPRGGGTLGELTDTLGKIWQSVLERDVVGHDDNFFDLGGNSLLLADVHRQLDDLFPGRISRTDLFRLPTIESLGAHLSGTARRSVALNESPPDSATNSGAVAIVGMACQTPGAADIDGFWDLVQSQRRAMRVFSDAELLDAGVDGAVLSDPHYVRVGAVLDDPALFDADLFGMSPREAQITDPQHRLLLETAHCALEHAGYGSALGRPRCGVFVGATPSGYFHRYFAHGFHDLDPVQHYQIKIGNEIDFLPTLLAYKLDLHGPAMAVQTACSTSLVAVHLAAEALGRNECDIALAGGVTVRVPDRVGYRYQDGMVQSPDGHCRAFDNAAAGTVFGSGVGVVVLKRVQHALRDGDRIYAVIRGSAVNNDGSDKVGYTAPSVRGQAEVIAKAHRQAGVTPRQIGYVEAHGTGTALGDPIEITALAEAFSSDGDFSDVCTIGSVKANIGHLDAAAGVVGLIKTALALDHGVRPGQCDVTEPSTCISWSQTPFRVYTHFTPWPENAPFAGVSAFGIGGTNAHVVLEPPPQVLPHATLGPTEQCGMLALSARTPEALAVLAGRYIVHLGRYPDVNLVDLCRTAVSGRTHHRYRIAAAVSTVEDLECTLDAFAQQRAGRAPRVGTAPDVAPRIAVILAGEFDAESLRFVMNNLESDIIAAAVGQCRTAFSAAAHSSDSEWLAEAPPAQRAFTAQFAVTRLWTAVGLRPAALVGIGDGELAAAVWASAIDLNAAADYVRAHSRLTADRVRLTDLQRHSGPELLLGTQGLDDIVIARTLRSDNIDLAVLLSGTRSARASLREQLRRSEVRSTDGVDRNHRGTWREFYGCAASLFTAGVNLDAGAAGPMLHGRRIGLPTYPMQRTRHWVDQGPATNATQPVAQVDQSLAGQANYAATNACLDATVHRLRARGVSCTSIAWDLGEDDDTDGRTVDLRELPTEERAQIVRHVVLECVAATLGLDVDEVLTDVAFIDLGLSSLALVEFRKALAARLNITMPSDVHWKYPTVDALLEYLMGVFDTTALQGIS